MYVVRAVCITLFIFYHRLFTVVHNNGLSALWPVITSFVYLCVACDSNTNFGFSRLDMSTLPISYAVMIRHKSKQEESINF